MYNNLVTPKVKSIIKFIIFELVQYYINFNSHSHFQCDLEFSSFWVTHCFLLNIYNYYNSLMVYHNTILR